MFPFTQYTPWEIKSELIMRGTSLRKYTQQLWSRMACNSLPDPIPNLLIRWVFFLSLCCSNLTAELTQMGTCCPIKDTFKAKHVIYFILQEDMLRLKTLSTTGWAEEARCVSLSFSVSLSVTTSEISDHSCSIEFVSDRAAWQMRVAVIADRVSSPGCKSF